MYTLKGYALPIQGHRDNHGLLLSQKQIDLYREQLSIPLGEEWEKYPNFSPERQALIKNYITNAPYNNTAPRNYTPYTEVIDIPEVLPCRVDKKMSTQSAFGQIMVEIGKSKEPFAERVITMAPDVTTSTNLSGFLNLRGMFSIEEMKDLAKEQKIMSMNKWEGSPKGQHICLGIAENNLMSLLAAAGHSSFLFGQRLLPIGTVYDPFISRALDAMNYGCYIDSRFMLVATPSGLTLSREGGAHQSIYTPLIGMGQPGIIHLEPAYADELAVVMAWGLKHMQKPNGASIYMRLSTRPLHQDNRQFSEKDQQDLLSGAYWRVPPKKTTPKNKRGQKKGKQPTILMFCGAVAPEARAAYEQLTLDHPNLPLSLLQVLSPDLLYSNFQERGENSHISELLREGGGREAKVVCVYDSHPSCLGWVGGVIGQKVKSLGVKSFGQCGGLNDLYRAYGIDKDSVVKACLEE